MPLKRNLNVPCGCARNVISGNGLNGIYIVSNPFRNSIDSNYIGLNKAGTAAVPNMGDGILGYFSGLEFFQNNEITRNVISGNKANGIYFQLFSLGVVSLNTIAENTIGRNAANTNATPTIAASALFTMSPPGVCAARWHPRGPEAPTAPFSSSLHDT